MELIIIKNERNGKISKRGAYIYTLKKDGSRYANPSFIDASGMEKTQEDVLARMQRNNPNRGFELAGYTEHKPNLRLQY